MMSERGTTIGYEKNCDGKVIPKVKKIQYPEKQIRQLKYIQEGVEAFQKIYLENKEHINLTADADKKNWFDIEKYLNRKMKVRGDEVFEVLEVK